MGIGDFEQLETMPFIPGWTSIMLDSGMELNIMSRLSGFEKEEFHACYEKAQKAEIAGVEVFFLHINHLIHEKRTCSLPKDLLDLEELEKLQQKQAGN